MLRKLAYVYHFVITFLKGEKVMAIGDFDGERAVTAYSEHVHFPFFIVEIFFCFLVLLFEAL